MIGLDTNVLVRYIMQDDARQSPLATRLIESCSADAPGFVPLVAIVELFWVMSSSYEVNRRQLAEALEGLSRAREFLVERAEIVWQALRGFQRGNADLADCLTERSAAADGVSFASRTARWLAGRLATQRARAHIMPGIRGKG
jgi:predicted nucleic-acid-binding protein